MRGAGVLGKGCDAVLGGHHVGGIADLFMREPIGHLGTGKQDLVTFVLAVKAEDRVGRAIGPVGAGVQIDLAIAEILAGDFEMLVDPVDLVGDRFVIQAVVGHDLRGHCGQTTGDDKIADRLDIHH